jgi:transposase
VRLLKNSGTESRFSVCSDSHLCLSRMFRRNATDDGSAKHAPSRCSTTSAWKIRFPKTTYCDSFDQHIDLSFVRERLKNFYSGTGRPSIDPEVLLRLLLVGYLYGITSERRLLEEVRMHLAYRWFTRLDFEQEIPDHSTFSKNRHGRFRQSGVFREVFEEIVRRCLEAGLVEGKNLAVDGTMVGANASRQSRVRREQLQEAAQVSRTVQEYLGLGLKRRTHSRRLRVTPYFGQKWSRSLSLTLLF